MNTVRINNRIYKINGYKRIQKGSGRRKRWIDDKKVIMLQRISEYRDNEWINVEHESIPFKIEQFGILIKFNYSPVILCCGEEVLEPLEKIFKIN